MQLEFKQIVLPEDNLHLQVAYLNFTTMLSKLLKNSILNQVSNLVVSKSSRFARYKFPSGKLSEVYNGH